MLLFYTALAQSAEICVNWSTTDPQTFEDLSVDESSGLSAGYADPSVIYTLEDEDNKASLYRFSTGGLVFGEQKVENAENVDWEDMASGPCMAGVEGDGCLYIGDIGDNDEVRDSLTLYIVPESDAESVTAVACPLVYPEGERHNAETLLLFPDGTIRIVTKEADGEAKVFLIDTLDCGQETVMVREAVLQIPGSDEAARKITAGTVGPEGQVILRSYTQGFLWDGCPLNWSAEPQILDLGSQPAGEALFLGADNTLWLSSESSPFRIWGLPCAETAEVCASCGCEGDKAALLIFLLPLWQRRRRN